MMVRANAERNADIIARRLAGDRPRQIAKDMGLGRHIVGGVLRRAGLTDPDSIHAANRRGKPGGGD